MKIPFLGNFLLAASLLFAATVRAQSLAGFTLTGEPRSAGGATWTFQGTREGVAYDLQGILYYPRTTGKGPFGAVVVSHGKGGNARNYSAGIAMQMREWGLVVIATHYTHAAGVPVGAPGDATQEGASEPNILRGRLCLEILQSLPEVDKSRIAAHGHSMGAFLTGGLVGTTLGFKAASHTAGGVAPKDGFAATSRVQAAGITVPYQMHHGDIDNTVLLSHDQRLDSILAVKGLEHELMVYPGYNHGDIPLDALMLGRVKAWYSKHGVVVPVPSALGRRPVSGWTLGGMRWKALGSRDFLGRTVGPGKSVF